MKFIVDAQLPKGIARILLNQGFDAIHTDDLPDKERTTDNQIRDISIKENRIVISKDLDFVDSYYIKRIPQKLLIITTGNIKNKELYYKILTNINQIVELLRNYDLVEMSNDEIIGHE